MDSKFAQALINGVTKQVDFDIKRRVYHFSPLCNYSPDNVDW